MKWRFVTKPTDFVTHVSFFYGFWFTNEMINATAMQRNRQVMDSGRLLERSVRAAPGITENNSKVLTA